MSATPGRQFGLGKRARQCGRRLEAVGEAASWLALTNPNAQDSWGLASEPVASRVAAWEE
jgi:hypothetical protein